MRLAAVILGAAAVLIAVAPARPASSAPVACSYAAAQAAIAQTKPRLALFGNDKVRITRDQAGAVRCFDATGDGRGDMAVSIASGGTAGDVGWLFFMPDGARWHLAGSGNGYKLALYHSGPKVLVIQPVYRAKDPNCCPTGGFDRTLYRWNGKRLVVARAWHTKTFK